MLRTRLRWLWLCALLAAPSVRAGAWGVTPIMLEFEPAVKTGSISVSNDDKAPLHLQLKLMSWTQDAKGADVYTESEDLVFFPRIMTVKPGASRVVRVGIKQPPPEVEKAYRLFLEEIPGKDAAQAKGAHIAVRLRFGVPIFVGPRQARLAGSIGDAQIAKGELRLQVRNSGNRRFRFETLKVTGGGRDLGAAEGWYLLAGAQREYRIALDPDGCAAAGTIRTALAGDGLELERELSATPPQCQK